MFNGAEFNGRALRVKVYEAKGPDRGDSGRGRDGGGPGSMRGPGRNYLQHGGGDGNEYSSNNTGPNYNNHNTQNRPQGSHGRYDNNNNNNYSNQGSNQNPNQSQYNSNDNSMNDMNSGDRGSQVYDGSNGPPPGQFGGKNRSGPNYENPNSNISNSNVYSAPPLPPQMGLPAPGANLDGRKGSQLFQGPPNMGPPPQQRQQQQQPQRASQSYPPGQGQPPMEKMGMDATQLYIQPQGPPPQQFQQYHNQPSLQQGPNTYQAIPGPPPPAKPPVQDLVFSLDGLSKEKAYELIKELKNMPMDDARGLLKINPTLTKQLLTAVISCNLITEDTLQELVEAMQRNPPPPETVEPPKPAQQALPVNEQQELINMLMKLTPQEIDSLPPAQRKMLLDLRQQQGQL
ncbi:hypothetical protein SARC_03087 [Sphaeroforma arctica JP610]|uniref:Transcription termination and cleavage factor C-terminal domain-containing protein n=1 Tax=Sphaeroforma arctica JP610 TaxID=667725 RepID=A0A0L0G8Z4_9EUKA|nr:hypothetical protein SARC_03087 [Sphaeroforma arctica JP610]KNC84713.1 hypothetical protein SARC_03087 [Sphaeroforma arctica JP610]|eukprot:XP_014158615.1 hypothetical protein SARC_03087 [Sphaeroforma arctica JP610]